MTYHPTYAGNGTQEEPIINATMPISDGIERNEAIRMLATIAVARAINDKTSKFIALKDLESEKWCIFEIKAEGVFFEPAVLEYRWERMSELSKGESKSLRDSYAKMELIRVA